MVGGWWEGLFLTNDGQLVAVQLAQLALQHVITCTHAHILFAACLPHPLRMLHATPGSPLTTFNLLLNYIYGHMVLLVLVRILQ